MADAATAARPTVRILHLPQTTTARDLLTFLESHFGPGSVSAIDIPTDRRDWKPRSYARVLFSSLRLASSALSLATLTFGSHRILFSPSFDDVLPIPHDPRHRVDRGSSLVVGFVFSRDVVCELGRWDGVRGWVMPDRNRVEFWVFEKGSDCFEYKMEVKFEDVIECVGCRLDECERVNAVVIKFKYGPRIYRRVSGPQVVSKFQTDRYHIYKEDFDFLWVRTTDFTPTMAIGQSNCFVWKIDGEVSAFDVFGSLPFYKAEAFILSVEEGDDFYSRYYIVPLLESSSCPKLDYEVFFQLNSLVHTQKISLAAAYALADYLSTVDVDSAVLVLDKLHKLKTICYEPVPFVNAQLHVLKREAKHVPSCYVKRLMDGNGMYCHRALVTPTKIYCLGPELETSNYVVKNFMEHASDFLRVSFVEEDWSKIPINAISTSTRSGLFSKPFRTEVYHRILNVLQDGIVIGEKRFQFLAFSASQLRSSSVWMFASNEKVTAEQIREWMGCFKNIRSISKCAARMGQLFSSSIQTHVVPTQDVDIIPDIEINTDGVNYCFSDGIGKISLPFARQVAQKCGLSQTPSAFQIRYGGYKGVIAVDRRSFRKLSLRDSMLKFESSNKMLNVTKWSEAMPCYLNREIITLLSTLGVKDEVFEAMQHEQLLLLGKMLTDTEAALRVLESLSGADRRNILVKMLQMGYKPIVEPFLLMMLRVHHVTQMAELKSRCRINVKKGRVLLGCLDETGILNYGQVYVRVTLTKADLESRQQKFFQKIDETTSVLIGKVVVTKNPCLHPGDIRVLEAIYDTELEEMGSIDCVVFPQKGERPHPNECSGGDLDGDLYFVSWEEDLIPPKTEPPMDYTGRRPRIMDHDVTLQEIYHFFVDYMINDTLGAISTAHLVRADREPDKARSENCLQLATLHSMAVDFAKTGAPAEMPRFLKPREFPDFMERTEKPTYVSTGVLGKLYRATINTHPPTHKFSWSRDIAEEYYDAELVVDGFESYLKTAESHRETYTEKLSSLMHYYGAESEDEILTGNLQKKASYLQRDNRKYGDMKDRISLSVKSLQKEAKGWFDSSCVEDEEHRLLASAWYHVTYHPDFFQEGFNFLSFPWIVGDVLLGIKSENRRKAQQQNN